MSIDKKELVRRVPQRMDFRTGTVEELVDATLEEIYSSLKQGESVFLRNGGTFYVRVERVNWVFKFNPSQRAAQVVRLVIHSSGGGVAESQKYLTVTHPC